jgi:hypothetical protein
VALFAITAADGPERNRTRARQYTRHETPSLFAALNVHLILNTYATHKFLKESVTQDSGQITQILAQFEHDVEAYD